MYNPVAKFCIRAFKAVPFVYEIKNVIDFSITKTGLDVFQWLKLEDAYLTLYLTKAEMVSRKMSKKFGEKAKWYVKISQGWCFLFGLISLILCPMLFFSTLNPNYIANNPIKGKLSMDLWCYQDNGVVKEFNNFSVNQLS